MKRFFVYLLIVSVFLNLHGCYSYKDVSSGMHEYDEEDHVKIITRNGKVYSVDQSLTFQKALWKIKNEPGCTYCTEWKITGDSISLSCFNFSPAVPDTFAALKSAGVVSFLIPLSDVGIISIREFNYAPLVALAILGLLVALFWVSPPGFSGNWSGTYY